MILNEILFSCCLKPQVSPSIKKLENYLSSKTCYQEPNSVWLDKSHMTTYYIFVKDLTKLNYMVQTFHKLNTEIIIFLMND